MFADAPTVSPAEVETFVAAGWQLLDVRTDQEWQQAHAPGSVHIPMDALVARLDEIADRVICVCAVGARSARVAAYLTGQGREAANLAGGLQAWAAEGRPLVA